MSKGNFFLMIFLHGVGIAIVGGIFYAFFKKIAGFVLALLGIAGAVFSYYLTADFGFPWYLSIVGMGLLLGLLTIPIQILDDISKIEKRVNILESKIYTQLLSKSENEK